MITGSDVVRFGQRFLHILFVTRNFEYSLITIHSKMSEDVIELSIEETNKLRAELGLAPLRLSLNQQEPHTPQQPSSTAAGTKHTKEEEVLELSVDETNALREKLGLAPLRTTGGSTKKPNEVHKPAENDRDAQEIADRIAQARLRREVEANAIKTFGISTLATIEENGKEQATKNSSALSWAEQMRRQKTNPSQSTIQAATSSQTQSSTKYDEKDLEGLHVAHDFNDLETGETTILTLADAPLLSESLDHTTSKKIVDLQEDDVVALENVTLAERKKQQDGLRKKRLLELGMGRAGGYAGFDDDEFEELGGVLGPSKGGRGVNPISGETDGDNTSMRGFRIGAGTVADSSAADFDKIQQGKAISLIPDKSDVVASDYMTVEEEETERATRKKKKDEQFKKKKKKKDKKRRKTPIDSSDEEEGQDDGAALPTRNPLPNGNNKVNVLEQLQESALPTSSGLRKRRRADDDDDDEQMASTTDKGFVAVKDDPTKPPVPVNNNNNKRAKYDEIMAKGNERTKLAFAEKKRKQVESSVLDEEPDDSFLNAALAKARRLNRLREMNQSAKGADAVAEAVRSNVVKDQVDTNGGVTFTIDDTREFTLALQARAQQKEREVEKAKQQQRSTTAKANQIVKREEEPSLEKKIVAETIDEEEEEEEDVDMEELANQVKTDDLDDDAGLDGSTARSAGVGRGLASFVSMLKTTGEISSKKAKEELKGRAKDEKNYENYAPMDLSKVVKIGRNATDKDRELANREIKLEYRDKHGRLLTTKEAFRDLCYQFHGYGASKKKEEKRLKQMEREQAQGRMASRQVAAARDGTAAGTLGALKATQKATGKAFIVHKT